MGMLLAPAFQGCSRLWMRRIWQLHLLYLVIALGISVLGWINLSITFPVFDGLFCDYSVYYFCVNRKKYLAYTGGG